MLPEKKLRVPKIYFSCYIYYTFIIDKFHQLNKMKTKLFFISLIICLGSFASFEEIMLNECYRYIDSNNPEDGLPSECDCDYKKTVLVLKKDFTFTLSKQKGRLEILSYMAKYGKWEATQLNKLILSVDSSFEKMKYFPEPIRESFDPPHKIALEIKNNHLVLEDDKVLQPVGNSFRIEVAGD